jgi:hypothetical protein
MRLIGLAVILIVSLILAPLASEAQRADIARYLEAEQLEELGRGEHDVER